MVVKNINNMIRSFGIIGRSYYFLYRILGIFPVRYRYYKEALIHNSASVMLPNGGRLNNERLEFLGDSVLSTVVCSYLYNTYPDWDEGKMSKRKAMLVKRAVINAVAEQMDIYSHILKKEEDNIYYKDISGNTLEAIIGAVYLDRGYKKAERFIKKKIIPMFESIENDILDFTINYKSILFEWVQRHHFKICINMVQEPKNNKHDFVCEIFINGEFVSRGSGHTKKESHQDASRMAIENLSETHRDISVC